MSCHGPRTETKTTDRIYKSPSGAHSTSISDFSYLTRRVLTFLNLLHAPLSDFSTPLLHPSSFVNPRLPFPLSSFVLSHFYRSFCRDVYEDENRHTVWYGRLSGRTSPYWSRKCFVLRHRNDFNVTNYLWPHTHTYSHRRVLFVLGLLCRFLHSVEVSVRTRPTSASQASVRPRVGLWGPSSTRFLPGLDHTRTPRVLVVYV